MITLIHPSRSRPVKARETMRKWLDNAGCEVEYILSLDYSDPLLEQYEAMATHIVVGHNSCVVEATNRAAKEATGDIFIYTSDDFDCPPLWGPLVKSYFNEPGAVLLKVDDCLQPFDVAVLTIPMMNRKLYETLGYFWHPGYKSMFVDEDLYWTSKKLGALKLAQALKFPHEHVSIGKAENDETYRRSAANWDQGKAFFAQRKAAGFPV